MNGVNDLGGIIMQTESEQLFEESKKYIPGGVNSPVRAFGSVGRSPIFIKKAKGSRIFDEDGREYIDYVCSWGPGILGHAKETVIEAVKAACDDGLTFGAPTRKELEIAELITAHGEFRYRGSDERNPCGARIYRKRLHCEIQGLLSWTQ